MTNPFTVYAKTSGLRLKITEKGVFVPSYDIATDTTSWAKLKHPEKLWPTGKEWPEELTQA